MIAFTVSIDSVAQLVLKPKESKAQEPNIENSQYPILSILVLSAEY